MAAGQLPLRQGNQAAPRPACLPRLWSALCRAHQHAAPAPATVVLPRPPPQQLLQLVSQMLLHKLLPFLVSKPALLLLNTTTPYAAILRRGEREMAAFKAFLAVAAAALLAVLVRYARPALAAFGLAL